MSTWDNVKKSAKSFAGKGLLYGAIAGAVFGAGTLLFGAGLLYALSLPGLATIAGSVASGGGAVAAGVATGMAAGGASLLTLPYFALATAAGAATGAVVGTTGGAVAGGVYGAATDESNPMPKTVEKAAHKILEKAPHLARAVAAKVNDQQAATDQLAARRANHPSISPQAPELNLPADPKGQTTVFQDRIIAQTHEPEMAVAQR